MKQMMCALVAGCLSVLAASALAQQTVFKTGVDLVRIDALVTADGKPVNGLGPSDFEVVDNGVPQRIEMAGPDARFDVILTLDMSGSVQGDRFQALLDGVRALLAQLHAGEQVSLVTFNEDVALRSALTKDVAAVTRSLADIKPRGTTSMYDAVFSSLSLANHDVRTLLLLFSDGADNSSWLTGAQVIEAARRADVVVCPVAVAVSVQSGLRSARFLSTLADRTGGRLFHTESMRTLRVSMLQVLTEFRSRYVIAYTPTGVGRDDGWHRLEVRLKGRKADVKSKDGYLAHADR